MGKILNETDIKDILKRKGYILLDQIGEGGFGVVYEIKGNNGNKYVLKVLDLERRLELARTEYGIGELGKEEINAIRNAFHKDAKREITFLKELKNRPNIVKYIDSFERKENSYSDATAYFIIEDRWDSSLEDEQKIKGTYTEKEVVLMGIDICNALISLEEKDLLHRDIKPGNIFQKHENRQIKYALGDFGVSAKQEQRQNFGNGKSKLTRVGTWYYAAPEIINSGLEPMKTVEKSSDYYSLGATMYKLLTGTILNINRYDYGLDDEALKAILQKKKISTQLQNIIMKATEKKPMRRYKHAKDMQRALIDLAKSKGWMTEKKKDPNGIVMIDPPARKKDINRKTSVSKKPLIEKWIDILTWIVIVVYFLIQGYTLIPDNIKQNLNNHIEWKSNTEDTIDSEANSEDIPSSTNQNTRPIYLDSYPVPTRLNDKLDSGIIEIEGDLYQFPIPVEELLKNGWRWYESVTHYHQEGTETFYPSSYTVPANSKSKESFVLLKGEKVLWAHEYTNFSSETALLENCVITRMYIYNSSPVTSFSPSKTLHFPFNKKELNKVLKDYDFTVKSAHGYENYVIQMKEIPGGLLTFRWDTTIDLLECIIYSYDGSEWPW